MANKPSDDSLAGSFDELKRDFTAWFAAERALLRASVSSSARRMAIAAIMACIAVMVVFVALVVLANVLVQALAMSFGPITSGLMVGVGLLVVALILIVVVRALVLKPDPLRGRLRSSARFIWSQLHD